MQWASALSTHPSPELALDSACGEASNALGGAPDLVLVFGTGSLQEHLPTIGRRLSSRFPSAVLCGCSGAGVIADGREVERGPALGLVAATLPGVDVIPFHLGQAEVAANAVAPSSWGERLGVGGGTTHFVLLPDPFTCHTGRLIDALNHAFPDGTKVGGLASGGSEPGQNKLLLGDRVYDSGVVGIALQGNLAVDTVVAQGCRPIGSPMFVTRSDRNVIHEIDGVRPVEILEELYESLPPDDRERMRNSLFLGLATTDMLDRYAPGDFLIRNLLGIDEGSGALAVGALPRENTVVQFHLRDAASSTRDLEALLDRFQHSDTPPPAGALLFSCVGRGMGLYGEGNHDTTLFHKRFGATPMGGFFCNGEIGPIRGQTFLHGYTSAFALFRRLRVD